MGPVGLEPTTYGLKVRSSAIELEARREGHPHNRGKPDEADASLRVPRRPDQAERARAVQE